MHLGDGGELKMTTICKFRCNEVRLTAEGSAVTMTPVTSGSAENEKFFRFTPQGKLEMSVINPEVKFTPGADYYLTISDGAK